MTNLQIAPVPRFFAFAKVRTVVHVDKRRVAGRLLLTAPQPKAMELKNVKPGQQGI